MRPDDVLDDSERDHDLDQALSELVPPSPRSRSQERSMRVDLLRFIATGDAVDPSGAEPALAPLGALDSAPLTSRHRRRRAWATAGVAAGVMALVVGLVVARPGSEPAATSFPMGSVTAEPSTRPIAADVAPPVAAATSFALIALGAPPDGYVVAEADIPTESGGGGVLRYVSSASPDELWVIVRDAPGFFDQVAELGRRTWNVDGRAVWADGELDGCLPDRCSVGVQWNERTAVSISWVEPEGGTLAPGSDEASLLALVPTLVEDAAAWNAAPAMGPDGPSPSEAAGTLLVPGNDAVIETTGAHVGGPADSQSAVVRAPDGSMLLVFLLRNSEEIAAASPNARRVGRVDVEGFFESSIATYDIMSDCWFTQLSDGGASGGEGPWRSTATSLLEAMQPGETSLSVSLPADWTVLTVTRPGVVYSTYWQPPGSDGTIELLQSTDSGAAFQAAIPARDLQPVTFLGVDAWAGTLGADSASTSVYWFADGTYHTATAAGVTVAELEQIIAGLEPASVDDWETRFGPPSPPEASTGGRCPPPVLSVSAG